ncbi:MAG: proline iminopeptidase-family hydrolase [Gammaproteobacteria bacterium]
MPELVSATEGVASFQGFKTRFRIVGESRSRRPLLCIHGGPGWGQDYLQPLEEMSTTGRQVVFYDQLGCGGFDPPKPAVEWSLQLFLDELDAVRQASGLARCHILGHAWGGVLALEYALQQPAGLESLVLSSAVASVPQWRRQLAGLVAAMPEEVRTPLKKHAEAGTTASPECCCTVDAFLRRHLCRMNPWPDCLARSQESARAHPEARNAMFGPNELEPRGRLEDWDVMSRLAEISCPTLVLSGRHDLAPPPAVAPLYRGIRSSEWVVFEQSAHVPHLEEPQRYLEVLDGFLEKVEGAERGRR